MHTTTEWRKVERLGSLRIDLYIVRLAISAGSSIEDEDHQRRVRPAMLHPPLSMIHMLPPCLLACSSIFSFANAHVASGVNSLYILLAFHLDFSRSE